MNLSYLLIVPLLLAPIVRPSPVIAEDFTPTIKITVSIEAPKPITNKEYVTQLVAKYAKKYGVSKDSLMRTIINENGNFDYSRQSDCTYKEGNRWGFKGGSREKSYGLAMIHLPDHPNITYEQAIDPEFAVDYMAYHFSLGHQLMWSGYRG